MSDFAVRPTAIAGVHVVARHRRADPRGFFGRFFCASALRDAGFPVPIAQINHTLTKRRGAARGLHFQHPPFAEIKHVSCLRGEVFDVAVDLRAGSPTFLRWHAEVLSADNASSLIVPTGCAHGFQTLTDDCELLYLHSTPYNAAAEAGFHLTDPTLAIAWPLAIAETSDRDARLPTVPPGFTGLTAEDDAP